MEEFKFIPTQHAIDISYAGCGAMSKEIRRINQDDNNNGVEACIVFRALEFVVAYFAKMSYTGETDFELTGPPIRELSGDDARGNMVKDLVATFAANVMISAGVATAQELKEALPFLRGAEICKGSAPGPSVPSGMEDVLL